jgi:hypothetical protein
MNIRGAAGKLQIFGMLVLSECLFDPLVPLLKERIRMTYHRSSHACILGRELINRIPVLKNGLDTTRKLVDELSLRIRGVFKNRLE